MLIKNKFRKKCNICVSPNLSDSEELGEQEISATYINEKSEEKYQNRGKKSSVRLPSHEKSVLKKAFFWICGIEKDLITDLEESKSRHNLNTSIEEHAFEDKICNINGVLILAVAGFFYAFFNKYN